MPGLQFVVTLSDAVGDLTEPWPTCSNIEHMIFIDFLHFVAFQPRSLTHSEGLLPVHPNFSGSPSKRFKVRKSQLENACNTRNAWTHFTKRQCSILFSCQAIVCYFVQKLAEKSYAWTWLDRTTPAPKKSKEAFSAGWVWALPAPAAKPYRNKLLTTTRKVTNNIFQHD